VLLLVGAFLFCAASPSRGQEAVFDQRHLWEVHPRVRVAPERPQELRHAELCLILRQLVRSSPDLQLEEVGRSVEGRALHLVRAGRGPQRVLLWSQMHGDEPTATGALLDVLSYLSQHRREPFVARTLEGVTILAMPMLNPDGAMRAQRRNALGIDINRDARALQTPEGQALKAVRERYQPQFAFNLHDQSGRRTVGGSGKLAAVALLAPPFDWEESDNPVRVRAKKLAAVIAQGLAPFVYGHISRYDAGFMPRAFGDAMQAWGTSTVLLETGGWYRDDPQFMVRLNFVAILTALHAIATGAVELANPALYDALPENGDPLYDLLVMDALVWDGVHDQTFRGDLAINFDAAGKAGSDTLGVIADIGDLDGIAAKDTVDASGKVVVPGFFAVVQGAEQVSLADSLRALLAAGCTSAICAAPVQSAGQFLTRLASEKYMPTNVGVAVYANALDVNDTCAALRLAACLANGALGVVANDDTAAKPGGLGQEVVRWFGRAVVGAEKLPFPAAAPPATWEGLRARTSTVAEAFHLPDRVSIAVGKVADLTLLKLPAGALPQGLATAQVTQVLVGGRLVWENGRLLRADGGRLLARVGAGQH
jgi:hypothetical protein